MKKTNDEILNDFLEYCKEKSGERYHYSYAFGWISAMLTDKQIEQLEKVTSERKPKNG